MNDLKIERKKRGQKRILATVGEKRCLFGCIYCFVNNENYPGISRIDTPDASKALENAMEEIDLLQPAIDVEFFSLPNAISVLENLAQYNKPISFATKSTITISLAKSLSTIHKVLLSNGAILQIAVSLSCLDNWQEIEPFAPSPLKRIETLKILYDLGIPTTVALRPLLPFVSSEEIQQIVELTHNYCYAYLTGPTYLTPNLKNYMSKLGLGYSVKYKKASWMPGSPLMEVIRSPNLERILRYRANSYNLSLFDDNVSLVLYLNRRCAMFC